MVKKETKNNYLEKVDDTFAFSSLIFKHDADMHTTNPAVSYGNKEADIMRSFICTLH